MVLLEKALQQLPADFLRGHSGFVHLRGSVLHVWQSGQYVR